MPSKETMDTIEATMEAIETKLDSVTDTLGTLERIPKVNLNGTTKQQQVLILSTVMVASASIGAVAMRYAMKWSEKRRNKKVLDLHDEGVLFTG